MTPRTIENIFSQELLNQSKSRLSRDLTLEGKILEKVPPMVLWVQLKIQEDPSFSPPKVDIDGWYFDCFDNKDQAQAAYPQITDITLGHPWRIYQILFNKTPSAIIEFPPLGTAVISKLPLKELGTNATLPSWIKYALSPELWGEEGKWSRFHMRLHELFSKFDLLRGPDLPGYYLLNNKIKQRIESFGYTGTNLGKDYLIVLPWTFSLTDLENIEKTVQEL